MPVSSTPDETLLARMAERDQQALSTFYDRYRAVVFALALRILKDRAEAEEAIGDVFLQAWRQAGAFDRTRGSAGAWLITLCRSRAIDRLRARGRRAAAQDALARAGGSPQTDTAPSGAGPEEAADVVMRRRRIGAALSSLSPEQRRSLEMAYYEGLSHSEIAAALGEPLGTVKTRIRQGLIILRQKLSGQFES